MFKHVLCCEGTLLGDTSDNRKHWNTRYNVLLSFWTVIPQPTLGARPHTVKNRDKGNAREEPGVNKNLSEVVGGAWGTLTARPREEEEKE